MSIETNKIFESIADHKRSSEHDYMRDRYTNIGSVGEQRSKRDMSKAGGEYLTKGNQQVNASKIVRIQKPKVDNTFDKFSIIATNAPTYTSLPGFLDLAFTSNKVDGIVVLGQADGRTILDYWSSSGIQNTALYAEPYKVTLHKTDKGNGYIKYFLTISDERISEEKDLPLWNYYDWPDKRVPRNPNDFEEFVKLFSNKRKLLVHCSAGVGRTGVFAACVQALREGKNANPKEIVESMREARTMMVQQPEQFEVVCKFILRNCLDEKTKEEFIKKEPNQEIPKFGWNEKIDIEQLSKLLHTTKDKLEEILQ